VLQRYREVTFIKSISNTFEFGYKDIFLCVALMPTTLWGKGSGWFGIGWCSLIKSSRRADQMKISLCCDSLSLSLCLCWWSGVWEIVRGNSLPFHVFAPGFENFWEQCTTPALLFVLPPATSSAFV